MPLEIKDCPFCGADEERLHLGDHAVVCRDCGGTGPNSKDTFHALDSWNTRAHDEIPSYVP